MKSFLTPGRALNTAAHLPVNPEVLISAAVPVGHHQSPLEPAWHALAQALDTNNVRLVFSIHDGQVFYVGAREQEFDGAGIFTTRLAAALPGGAAFQGDAAYLDTSAATPAMLLVKDGSLSARTGSRENLASLARRHGLPVVELDEVHVAEWQTLTSFNARAAWKRVAAATWVGVAAYLVGLAFCGTSLWVTSASRNQADQARSATQTLKSQLVSEMGKSLGSPLAEQLRQLQRVQQVALENGGTLDYWTLGASGVTFQLTLPEYVRSELYASLGPLTSVEKRGHLLVLTRDPSAKGKK